MSMPNPQYDQVLRMLSEVAGRFPLWLSNVENDTRYVFNHELAVECLGLYKNDRVAIFGEWYGPQDQKPKILAEDIQVCNRAFLVRSATEEEVLQHGCSKAIECIWCGVSENQAPVKTIYFHATYHVGFYNPIV